MIGIYHDLHIQSNVDDVFRVVSNPESINQWWTLKCSGSPVKGAQYNFNFTEQFDWYATVTKVEINKCIFFKMSKCDEDWQPTTFGFEIEAIDTETVRVSFSHIGWKEVNHSFRRTSYCWAHLLKLLKDYVETGNITEFSCRSEF